MTRKIRVLIADDSAFARKVIREMLDGPQIEVVGAARDGMDALEQTAELKPDLVITDLVMPRLNGAEFVRRQMAVKPLPILILSSAAQEASEVLEALNSGAIDVVQKPTALATDELRDVQVQLVEKVLLTMRMPTVEPVESPASQPLALPDRSGAAGKVEVIVLGISTGGPQALRRVMPQMPKDLPVPMAVVLHMPVGYTALYAEKLNEICAVEVKEAADGDVLRPGLVLLAQAGRHLTFRRETSGRVVAQLSYHPMDRLHRPSVDIMFRSAAEVFRSRTLGVVMTGMGDDGKEGSAWIKAQGGTILTEAENSCVIYGMPRSVVEAGLSDAAVSLDQIAQTILARL